jgi:hypothetical protein
MRGTDHAVLPPKELVMAHNSDWLPGRREAQSDTERTPVVTARCNAALMSGQYVRQSRIVI